MRLIPHSYNGFLFQQQNKVATDFQNPYDWDIQGITTNEIPRSQNFPLRAAKNYAGTIKVLNVNLLDVDMSRDDLVIAMNVLGAEQGQLIALDELGRSWYINADFIGLTEDTNEQKTASFGGIFSTDDPIWKKLVPSTATIAVGLYGTGSGTLTPIGNQPALPVITITPTGAGAFGFTYKRFIQVVNNSPDALIDYPINLTGSGLDTATLIGAGKMLASGDDLRIYVDGVEVKRWFGGGGINSSTTKIWINWSQPANTDMTLGGAIASSGAITLIQLQNTAAVLALITSIPTTGNVLIGSEIFVYTGVNAANLQLTGVTRAERLTSEAAHSLGDAIKFVTHDVWLYYGYAAIAPYVVDDTKKPIISLNSTNTSWIYAEFQNNAGTRTASWKMKMVVFGNTQATKDNRWYTATENTYADPASVIGLWLRAAEELAWDLYQPCGVLTVTATGKKYRSELEVLCGLTASANGNEVVSNPYPLTFWVEGFVFTHLVWTALDTHSAVSVGQTVRYLRFRLSSSVNNISGAACEFADMTLALDSTKTPTVNLSSEASGFTLNSILSNAATGYTMELELTLPLNSYIVVNTKEKTITLFDGTNEINALKNMPVRLDWFPLLPSQANVITITDAGQVTYAFSFEDRSL
jgi:hypothetical protein